MATAAATAVSARTRSFIFSPFCFSKAVCLSKVQNGRPAGRGQDLLRPGPSAETSLDRRRRRRDGPRLSSAGDQGHSYRPGAEGTPLCQGEQPVHHFGGVYPIQGERVAFLKVGNELVKHRIAFGEATEVEIVLDRPVSR